MKKFKFRLEQVLEYRMTLKSERKRELLAANARLREAEEESTRLSAELLRYGIGDGEILSVGELVIRSAYRDRTKSALAQQRDLIALRTLEAGKALEAYIEAAKDANALETLKKKRFQEYMERIQKEEERVLDESAVQRAGRAMIAKAYAKRKEANEQNAAPSEAK